MHAEQLKLSSQRWMNAALTAFSQGPDSYDFAVHHAGIAAEHLLKAYLASLHPALIVEAKDFDSLLHATGHGTHASAPASRAKTIGLMEAHARVHKILRKQIPIDQRAFMPVANARNGVAHSGIHDLAEVQTVFTTCLRLADPILEELKIDPETYWGPYRALHDRLIEEQVKQTRVDVETMLVNARSIFWQRFGHLSDSERKVVLATITSHPAVGMAREVPQQCPACDSQGWLAGEVEVGREGAYLVTHVFACSACDLEVEGEMLWHLGDLAGDVPLDDNPEDYLSPYEDDDGDMRFGR
ncbi:hypothetical protein [Streptomyces californicus]|uniref:hypothetical protein n=1 Tax=Streptomyces californicus TaxID=67351 RepID=UPI0033A2DFE0